MTKNKALANTSQYVVRPPYSHSAPKETEIRREFAGAKVVKFQQFHLVGYKKNQKKEAIGQIFLLIGG